MLKLELSHSCADYKANYFKLILDSIMALFPIL